MTIVYLIFGLLGAAIVGCCAHLGQSSRALLLASVFVASCVTFLCFFVLNTRMGLFIAVVPMAAAMGGIYVLGRAIFARHMIPAGL